MSIRIIGTGSALPEKCVTNHDLAKFLDTSDEWIRERTGIGSRYLSTGETVAYLAGQACERALADAGKKAEEVELLMAATCSPEMALPCTACQVQAQIGASNAAAFDLNAACAGFLFALNTAYAYIEAGIYKNALIVGAEVLSKLMDWTDRGTCILFGDGAGAVLVEKCGEGGVPCMSSPEDVGDVPCMSSPTDGSGDSDMRSPEDGSGEPCMISPADRSGVLGFAQHSDGRRGEVLKWSSRDLHNPYFTGDPESRFVQMDGRDVFAFAVRQVPAAILEALEKAGLKPEDVDLYVLHQANKRIIEGIAKRLGVPLSKFPMNLDRVGNTSSAAIPLLLDELNRSGRLRRGMTVALSGFGAGLTYGACVLRW